MLYAGKKIAGVLKYEGYIECTNNMATFNRCDRIVIGTCSWLSIVFTGMDKTCVYTSF